MNTVSHVRYWLAANITWFADWFGGKVHVTPFCWLVVHWGGEHDQRVITACTLRGKMLGSWEWQNRCCFGNCGPITRKRNVQLVNLLHCFQTLQIYLICNIHTRLQNNSRKQFFLRKNNSVNNISKNFQKILSANVWGSPVWKWDDHVISGKFKLKHYIPCP